MKELIFRGRLRKGAERTRVIAALARRFKRTPEQIEQRLFSGRPVRIATVESRAEALRYATEFARLGAMLEIRDANASSAPQRPARATAGRRRRLAAAAAAALVLVALGAAGAWYTAPAWRDGDRSEAETAAVRGLATDDLLLLAHLDVERAALLEQRLLGPLDPGALLGDRDDPLTSLARNGIDLRRQVDDAILAGYVGADGFETALVLLGEFEPERVRQWIESHYSVEQYFNSTRTVHFRPALGDQCPAEALYAARLAGNRIVVSTPKRLPELARRIDAGARPAVPLDHWQRLSGLQVATLGLFAPDRMAEATDGLSAMILAGAAEANAPAESFYLGLGPTLLPPGVMLRGEIVSPDPAYLEATHRELQGFLDRALEQAGRGWPELVPLYQRAALERRDEALRASLRLDTDFDDELGTLFTAVVGDLFSITPEPVGQRAEAVEDNPTRFRDVGADAIVPFSRWDDADDFAWHEGPVAVAVESTQWSDNRHRLEIGIEGRALPNSGGLDSGLRFRVEDVLGHDGESLLATPECGADENRAWAVAHQRAQGSTFRDGEMLRYGRVLGTHELTLVQGASAADVASIRGRVEYRLPTRVEHRRLEPPLGGKVVEHEGLRVRFRPGAARELSYQYSGEIDRLLAIRALNAEDQVLRQGGSFGGDQLFAPGRHRTVSHYGEVAAAEVVIAEAFERRSYEFRLDGGLPTIGAGQRQPTPLPTLAPKGALARTLDAPAPAVEFEWNPPVATQTVDPLLITLERIQIAPGFGLYGSIGLYTPPDLPLAHDLNGARLQLDSLVRPAGTLAIEQDQTLTLRPDGAYWLNGEYTLREDRPWLSGSGGFQLSDYEGELPSAIEGRIELRTVTRAEATELSARVGNRKRGDVFDFVVTRWDGGDSGKVTVEVTGLVERIVSATARDADGRRVDTSARLQRRDDASWLSLNVNRWPQVIRVVYATASEQREFGFRLQPPR